MSADLEATLNELGPEYRSVVDRLRASAEAPARPSLLRHPAYLIAASILVLLAFAFTFFSPSTSSLSASTSSLSSYTLYTVAYAPTDEALRIILASQRADGSWDNDFITRQNAAALRRAADAETKIAYKRAVRYLRSKGLAPLSDDELAARAASCRVF